MIRLTPAFLSRLLSRLDPRSWWPGWAHWPRVSKGRHGTPAQATAPALPLAACATVVIPALNEAQRIADVVRHALSDPATAEVIVVDDSSIDATAELARQAGARVILSSMLGKGPSMRDGLEAARHELIVYLDGDLAGLRPGLVSDLCQPLLRGEADFVKARFGRSGGRVTELTAKPMLKVFFPEVAHFAQPLGGIVAARSSLLHSLSFEDGYGVDIGLLIGAARAGARLTEVDIGSLENDSQPLTDLTLMANEVSRVIYAHARQTGRLHVEQVVAMHEMQRQAAAAIELVLSRRRGRQRLLLLDMDGTLTTSRFVVDLARATGREERLLPLLDRPDDDAATRSQRIAELFRFVHREEFERVARQTVLRPDAIEFINRMRRVGFIVGVLSDSWFVAADIIRRRVFADFALAHLLQFDNDVCTGELRLNPAFLDMAGAPTSVCKSHVLRRFRTDGQQPAVNECWAIGDNLNDVSLLTAADRPFAMAPRSPILSQIPGVTIVTSFTELLALVPEPLAATAAASP